MRGWSYSNWNANLSSNWKLTGSELGKIDCKGIHIDSQGRIGLNLQTCISIGINPQGRVGID